MKKDGALKAIHHEYGYTDFDPPCTRRQTLIWGGAAIIGLSALGSGFVHGADRPLIIMEEARGLVIADPVLCVGCGRCELACTEFNDGIASPSSSRIKVVRNLNYGPPETTSRHSKHGNLGDGLIVQDLCKQCPHPVSCADICPENAIVLSPNTNARVIDLKKCTGCKVCLKACPWEMISYDPGSEKATKCHLCGGRPKCVEACPAGALSYIPWRDLTGSIPVRNLNPSPLPPERSLSCEACHLPGQPGNVRELSAMILGTHRGARVSRSGIGFKWIDLAGAMVIPLAIGAVAVHALLRKVLKR